MSRPGSEEARCLFATEISEDVLRDQWARFDNSYAEALAIVARDKKKPELIALDNFLHCELSKSVKERSVPHITHKEISDIMKWKLIRGQMRPLQKVVDRNAPSAVIDRTTDCMRSLLSVFSNEGEENNSAWESALSSLCELKGIGVATASAILSVFLPEICPFMADEVIEAVVSDEKRDYTLKIYKKMQSRLISKAKELNALENEPRKSYWTAERVGQALWVCAKLSSAKETSEKSSGASKRDKTQTESTEGSRGGKRRKFMG